MRSSLINSANGTISSLLPSICVWLERDPSVRVHVSEGLHVGDLLGADGEGNIRKITSGLIPVGVVVQPTNLENGTMVMRTCTTDEQVQYMRRIEEAYNRARRSAAMARNYEAASAGETQQILKEAE